MPWLALTLNGIHAACVFLYAQRRTLALLLCLFALRLGYLLLMPYGRRVKRAPDDTCHIAVFLGSGGHTAEMIQLIGALPPQRYARRTYITGQGDRFSTDKALEQEKRFADTEETKSSQAVAFVTLPRARHVHQTWLSTPASVIVAFLYSVFYIVLRPRISKRPSSSPLFADLILMNGPGTCVPIVAAVYLLRFFGLQSPRLMYVESFARVRSLSLTAKILRFFVDKFVVQWNENVVRGAHFQGWLV